MSLINGLGRHKRQVAVFGGVGFACMATDVGVYGLALYFGAIPVVAHLTAFLIANVQCYFMNGWLTFRGEQGRARFTLKSYGKFLGGYSLGLVLSTLVIWLLAGPAGAIMAKAVSILVAAISNYLVSHFIVFKPGDTTSASESP